MGMFIMFGYIQHIALPRQGFLGTPYNVSLDDMRNLDDVYLFYDGLEEFFKRKYVTIDNQLWKDLIIFKGS